MKNIDKYRGCLIGGAAGDALGYAVEFLDDAAIFSKYGENGITEYSLVNGVAEISDDTQMTLFTANAGDAEKYRELAQNGRRKLDEISWNGEFYEQIVDDVNAYRYQYGKGCLSDQLLGQFMAFNAQLGYVMSEEHVKKAAASIFKYNFVERAKENVHAERAFILNDEKGLTPCTWPNGGRPVFPFVYYGEVWTGIEYEACLLYTSRCV